MPKIDDIHMRPEGIHDVAIEIAVVTEKHEELLPLKAQRKHMGIGRLVPEAPKPERGDVLRFPKNRQVTEDGKKILCSAIRERKRSDYGTKKFPHSLRQSGG